MNDCLNQMKKNGQFTHEMVDGEKQLNMYHKLRFANFAVIYLI